MAPEQLKTKIKTKFKTLTNFAEIADMDRMAIQKALMPFYLKHPDYIKLRESMDAACDRLSPDTTDSASNAEKIARLKAALNDAGGTYEFCKQNPEFLKYKDAIFKILAGKRDVNGSIGKKILDHFKIE